MCTQKRGYFLTIEGCDGSGKSTAAKFLVDALVELGHEVLWTREPGGSPFAETLRGLLLESRDPPLSAEVDTLLMFAARLDHIEQLIKPNLYEGRVVVCERFTDSTYAYQVSASAVSKTLFESLEQELTGLIVPDATLFFDAKLSVLMRRLKGRAKTDKFEQSLIQKKMYFQKLRQGYRTRLKDNPERMTYINASQSIQSIEEVMHEWAYYIDETVHSQRILETEPAVLGLLQRFKSWFR
jgi:dTMP kinase